MGFLDRLFFRWSCLSNAERMYNTLRASALLLWIPHCLASLYVVTTANSTTFLTFLYVLTFYLIFIACTYYVAVYKRSGDFLLILSWVIGVLSEVICVFAFPSDVSVAVKHSRSLRLPTSINNINQNNDGIISYNNNNAVFGITTSSSSSSLVKMVEGNINDESVIINNINSGGGGGNSCLLWIIVSMLNGIIGGVLCKMKDIDEDRYYPTHTIGERLYVIVPFCTGQWLCFILQNGWWGIIIENLTIFFSLSMVGYCVVGYKLLQQHIVKRKWDIIGFLEELLTTSFGAVFGVIVFGSFFVLLLAIPFFKSLFSLNALVSSVGILLEFVVYEMI